MKWVIRSIFFGVVIAIIVMVYALYQTKTSTCAVVKEGSESGVPLIGGPIKLTTHEGKTFNSDEYKGQYLLVYFGFAFCPDICPTALSNITEALNLLGGDSRNIQPVFITIDPERDSIESLKAYVKNFHPKTLGLTGSQEDIDKHIKMFKVYVSKLESQDKDDKNYLLDHSSIVYLMGRDGVFLKAFSHETEPQAMASKISEIISKDRRKVST